MWIVIFNAVDDFGIREHNDVARTSSSPTEFPGYQTIETIKKKISDDALHGALRIAGLVSSPFITAKSMMAYPCCRLAYLLQTDIWYVSIKGGSLPTLIVFFLENQRLDSAVMHVSIIQAGTLLARLGRPEVENCIKGLNQYSYAYEECAEQAADIARQYNQAVSGESELGYMASVLSRPGPIAEPMTITDPSMAIHFNPTTLAGGYRGR